MLSSYSSWVKRHPFLKPEARKGFEAGMTDRKRISVLRHESAQTPLHFPSDLSKSRGESFVFCGDLNGSLVFLPPLCLASSFATCFENALCLKSEKPYEFFVHIASPYSGGKEKDLNGGPTWICLFYSSRLLLFPSSLKATSGVRKSPRRLMSLMQTLKREQFSRGR